MKRIFILSLITASIWYVFFHKNYNSYGVDSFIMNTNTAVSVAENSNNQEAIKVTGWVSDTKNNEIKNIENKPIQSLTDHDKVEIALNSLSEEKNFIKYINAISEKNKIRSIPMNKQNLEEYKREREELEKHLVVTDKIVKKNPKLIDLNEYFIYYNNIRNDIDNYKKAEEALQLASKKGFITKSYKIPSSVPIQKYNENTCVVNTLTTIMKYQYGKNLNRNALYKWISKKIWDYWMSEYYHYDWFENIWKHEWDYKKLASLWIYSEYITSTIEINNKLNNWQIALFEWPIEIFSKDPKWIGSNIYHAVAVFSIEDNIITYSDSLDWNIKKMDISKFINDKWHSIHPFRFFSFDNTKIEEIERKLFN